jgi:hypothetical protein
MHFLSILFELEVSGSPHVTDRKHYLKDKKKIEKNLKFILYQIYLMNPCSFEQFFGISIYGMLVYSKYITHASIYIMESNSLIEYCSIFRMQVLYLPYVLMCS